MSQKKQESTASKSELKQDKNGTKSSQKQRHDRKQQVVHCGVFIAEQRRKGKNGRIKSKSIPNKIEVRMKRDTIYLHQSQVQWVEISRYSKKQGRIRKRQQKKQKYKSKQSDPIKKFKVKEEKQDIQKIIKKYQQKKMKKELQTKQQQIQKNQEQQKQIQANKKIQSQSSKQQAQTSTQQMNKKQDNMVQNKDQQREKGDEQSSSSSDDDQKQQQKQENENKNEKSQDIQKQQKNKDDDIVIVAQIKKQIQNPFWKKPFVGIIYFTQINNKKSEPKFKQKQKQNISDVCKILDDYNLDIEPIHSRLPECYVRKNNASQKMLEQYVAKNMKFQQSQKGGKRRNRILDQFQSTYALVKFIQNYKGHIYVDLVKIIGKARTIDGQCDCFLYQHQLNDFEHTIPEQEEIQKVQVNISQIHKKFDELVFTIDPLTSTDLDDALSVTQINQKQYQFGIHISDVSSYLSKVSRQQLAKRTTSVYLPHNVFHMLPAHLTDICSLNPEVLRIAFSVFVIMNQDGQVKTSRIQKNIIKSRYKLAYQHAQGVIDGTLVFQQFSKLHNCNQDQYNLLKQKLKIMERIGMAHRKKRLVFEIFDNDQIKFQLDADRWPIKFTSKPRITSQKIIEQFMIIGNIQTAKAMTSFDSKNSLIIHHPPPSQLAIRQFNEYFQILGMKFKFQDTKSLQQDLLKVSKMQNISEQIKRLCYFKARRAQQTASYKRYSQVQNLQGNIHFALGLRFYTHFTSPMRRIADIIVHQTLNPVVDNTIPKKQLLDKQIEQANWGRRNTKRLKKDINQIYLCLMIYKTKQQLKAEAIAVSFGCKSISIYIPMLDISKQIMWKDMEVDKVYKNKQDEKKIDAVVYYDRKSSKGDIIWLVQKFSKFQVKIGCTQHIPLRLNFQFNVKTNKGDRKIRPK